MAEPDATHPATATPQSATPAPVAGAATPGWVWVAGFGLLAGLIGFAVWQILTRPAHPASAAPAVQAAPAAPAYTATGGDRTSTPAADAPQDPLVAGAAGVIATPPLIRSVPEFAFRERSGKTIQRADLLGKVWVADFIFTHCAGTCPVMTSSLRTVQEKCKDLPNLRLVSFTVDPERDTVETLKAYADSQGADPERWLFLTGDKATMIGFINEGFLLPAGAAAQDPNTPGIEAIMHSPRFVLVDETGRLKAMYTGTDGASVEKLIADLHKLPAAAAAESMVAKDPSQP